LRSAKQGDNGQFAVQKRWPAHVRVGAKPAENHCACIGSALPQSSDASGARSRLVRAM